MVQTNLGNHNPAQPNNLCQSNLGQPLSHMKPMKNFSPSDGEQGLIPTPKAVVKPQVLTHVIDGHVIKESSQPFPVSPVKGKKPHILTEILGEKSKYFQDNWRRNVTRYSDFLNLN